MVELQVEHERIKSEIMQILTADQKTKLAQLEAQHEANMSKHTLRLRRKSKHWRSSVEAGLAASLRMCLSPFRVRNGTPTSVLARPFSGFHSGNREETNGTRRPALLGTDVRRRHVVALDGSAAHRGLHCACAFAGKIRPHRCYNLIYKSRDLTHRHWQTALYQTALYQTMVPKNLRPLVPYLKRYRRGLVWGALCVLFNNGIWILFPQVLRRAVNDLNSGVTRQKLLTYSLLIIAIALIKGIFQFLTRWVVIGISRDIEFDLRNDLFAHLERLSHSYYQRNRTGDIMARATNDLNAVRMLLGPAIMYSANTLVFTAGALGFMLAISPKLTIIAFLPLPIASIVIQYFGRRIHERFERIQAMFSDISARAQENFSGARVIRAYVQEQAEIAAFETRQPGIHPPQPGPRPADGNALADAGAHAGRRRGHRAVGRADAQVLDGTR